MKPMLSVIVLSFAVVLSAQGSLPVTGAKELAKVFVKNGSQKAVKELAEFGGEKAIRETLEKVAKEGGEELVEKTIQLGKTHGLKTVKVIDASPKLFVNALDDLPKEIAESAIMAIQREPDTIARLLSQHGSGVLQTVAKHRGTGTRIVEKLGDDGIRMAENLTEKQGLILARRADEIANLPAPFKKEFIDKFHEAAGKAISFMEENPKVLLTAASVGVILGIKDDILGNAEIKTVNPDGSITISRPGFIERIMKPYQNLISIILATIGLLIVVFYGMKIWGVYKHAQIKITATKNKTKPNES